MKLISALYSILNPLISLKKADGRSNFERPGQFSQRQLQAN